MLVISVMLKVLTISLILVSSNLSLTAMDADESKMGRSSVEYPVKMVL